MKVSYGGNKPDPILYMHRPDTKYSDVWLRKNIEAVEIDTEEIDSETGELKTNKIIDWQADEVYGLTTFSKEEIENNFDNFYYSFGPQPTVEERLDIIEGVIGEIMEG